MNLLVKSYILSRGIRVALVILLAAAALIALSHLPKEPLHVFLRLGLLLIVLIWVFRTLKSAGLSFFLAALLALMLFQLPLDQYVKTLYGQAKSFTVFMIVLFGGTLAVVSRQDLIEARARLTGFNHDSDQTSLQNETAVFCLLQRFGNWIERTFDSKIWRAVFLLPLVLANFVSSATAVLFFKSLWAPTQNDFVNREQDRALAAGILSMCIGGVLLVFTGAGNMMSIWWLFFTENIRNPDFVPKWPAAVYLYGLLSYVHGFWLVFGRWRQKTKPAPAIREDIQVQRLKGLYLILLLISIAVVASTFIFFHKQQAKQKAKATEVPTVQQVPDISKDPKSTNSQKSEQHSEKQQQNKSNSESMRITVSTFFLGLLLAALLAQFLMYVFFVRPANELWRPSAFWDLTLLGMSRVFTTVVILVMILAFKDIVTDIIKETPFSFPAEAKWLLISLALATTFFIGRIIGSSWGAFALGIIVFNMADVNESVVGRTVVEALILLATWVNQSAPSADNAQIMLGPDKCTNEAVNTVWSVPTFQRYPRLKAKYIQGAIVVLSILMAVILRKLWPTI